MIDYCKFFDLIGKMVVVFGVVFGIGKFLVEVLVGFGVCVICVDCVCDVVEVIVVGICDKGGWVEVVVCDLVSVVDVDVFVIIVM